MCVCVVLGSSDLIMFVFGSEQCTSTRTSRCASSPLCFIPVRLADDTTSLFVPPFAFFSFSLWRPPSCWGLRDIACDSLNNRELLRDKASEGVSIHLSRITHPSANNRPSTTDEATRPGTGKVRFISRFASILSCCRCRCRCHTHQWAVFFSYCLMCFGDDFHFFHLVAFLPFSSIFVFQPYDIKRPELTFPS